MKEQEVKLRFESHEAARQAVIAAGGRLVRSERSQEDRFLDNSHDQLDRTFCALRVRREPHQAVLTFKGPVEAGPVKSREEIESIVADADALEAILGRLGFAEWWRLTKHREDYTLGEARVFIDRTPVGIFVEIEGTIDVIAATARALGKSEADYILESYRRLYRQ